MPFPRQARRPTPPPRAPESDADRRARHLDMLREMAELAMAIARDAAANATNPDPDAPDPALTFARATRAARQAIALEARIAAGDLHPSRPPRPANDPAAPPDPRRALLRQTLHKAIASDPNRAALRRDIDAGIERELGANSEGEIAIGEILAKLCEQLGLPFDASALPDHFLAPVPTSPFGRNPAATGPIQAAPPNPRHFHRRE